MLGKRVSQLDEFNALEKSSFQYFHSFRGQVGHCVSLNAWDPLLITNTMTCTCDINFGSVVHF